MNIRVISATLISLLVAAAFVAAVGPATQATSATASSATYETIPTKLDSSLSFTDIGNRSKFSTEILWLANEGISTGYSDGTFRPYAPITRDAMAAFMYRLAGEPKFTPPPRSPFSDMTPRTKFYKEVTWLASTGVTTGYSDGKYKPQRPVTRDAMAAFMYRLAGKPSYRAPSRSPFKDITTNSKFYKETAWLADAGVSTGWSDLTYRPFQSINRDAMAAFMYRFTRTVGVNLAPAPSNPGDIKNCSSFTKWRDAQRWYERYFPYYGDVARLDGNDDGLVCVSLPGAP